MKKIILMIFVSVLLFACTNKVKSETSVENSSNYQESNSGGLNDMTKNTKSNIIVVFFSATGNTKNVATKIANFANADLYEIIPEVKYTEADLNWNDNDSRTSLEQSNGNARPKISSPDLDLSKYKVIYLGYPIWWGMSPKIINTFVEKYDFKGKMIIPFCTSGSSGIEESITNLRYYNSTGQWLDGKRFASNVDDKTIEDFVNESLGKIRN